MLVLSKPLLCERSQCGGHALVMKDTYACAVQEDAMPALWSANKAPAQQKAATGLHLLHSTMFSRACRLHIFSMCFLGQSFRSVCLSCMPLGGRCLLDHSPGALHGFVQAACVIATSSLCQPYLCQCLASPPSNVVQCLPTALSC